MVLDLSHFLAKKTTTNHLKEGLSIQAQARAPYTALFWGHSLSVP